METIVNEIKSLQISDATARLIACQRFTDDIYENIMKALKDICTANMQVRESWKRSVSTSSTALRV